MRLTSDISALAGTLVSLHISLQSPRHTSVWIARSVDNNSHRPLWFDSLYGTDGWQGIAWSVLACRTVRTWDNSCVGVTAACALHTILCTVHEWMVAALLVPQTPRYCNRWCGYSLSPLQYSTQHLQSLYEHSRLRMNLILHYI